MKPHFLIDQESIDVMLKTVKELAYNKGYLAGLKRANEEIRKVKEERTW